MKESKGKGTKEKIVKLNSLAFFALKYYIFLFSLFNELYDIYIVYVYIMQPDSQITIMRSS